VFDGYLLRLVPTRLGSTEAEPQQVLLVRDVWSRRRSFHFVDPEHKGVAEAFVRFRPREPSTARSPVPAGDTLLQRAWTEHTMLAGMPACDSVPVQLGSFAEHRVHRLADGAEVRFVCPGVFTLEVATPGGLVGSSELRIEGRPVRWVETVRIQLVRGETVSGLVVNAATSAPLLQAELTVQGGEPLGLVATTAADGAFAIGPLPPGRVTLNVRHGDCEPQAVGPLTAPAGGVRIALQPLPQTSLRGRVRSRPELTPLAGADDRVVTRSRCARDGDEQSRWHLRAGRNGHDGREAARAGARPPVLCRARRAGLAVRRVRPVARHAVGPTGEAPQQHVARRRGRCRRAPRGQCDRALAAGAADRARGIPGRRVLEGATLELPLVATTGTDGAFALETSRFGPGKLTLVGAETAAGRIDVEAMAGKTINGLRLAQ
jgi:hypothetical protein